jgi:hypothetical protein
MGTLQQLESGADPVASVSFPGYGTKRIKASFLRFVDG